MLHLTDVSKKGFEINVHPDDDVLDPDTRFTPEQLLVLRCIERALMDVLGSTDLYLKECLSERRVQKEAYVWITSNETKPFSFLWCCDHLPGEDPDHWEHLFRSKMFQMIRKKGIEGL